MSRADDARVMSLQLVDALGESRSVVRFDREQADSHSGTERTEAPLCQPIFAEFFENDMPMIASQARDAHAARRGPSARFLIQKLGPLTGQRRAEFGGPGKVPPWRPLPARWLRRRCRGLPRSMRFPGTGCL